MSAWMASRRASWSAAILCVSILGCAASARGPGHAESAEDTFTLGPAAASESSLIWLARELAGRTGVAPCGTVPAFGDPLWFPDGRYCGLVTPDRGTVGFQLDARGVVHAVTWHRNAPNSAAAGRIVDSLDVVLKHRGLTTTWCAPGTSPAGEFDAVLWETEDLLVHLSTITPDTAPPRIVAMAVDLPAAFPRILCKPVPPGSVRPRASVSRERAAQGD